jgi:acetyl-CoA carboxylase beta subunit
MEIRCNICDETINASTVEQHVAGRNHGVKKKVAEFNEMNAQVKMSYLNDTSVVKAWIKDLYSYDFLSTGKT